MLFVLALVLCGCISTPFAEQVIPTDTKPNETTRKIYISGAVENDGYITVPQLCDYERAMEVAGFTDYSVMPSNPTSVIVPNVDRLIVGFVCDGLEYDSVNVNGGLIKQRARVDGVDDVIVAKLADYIETNGVIANRDMLRVALGDDYKDNYYKFYIDIDDYA